MEQWKYKSTHSSPRYWKEVSGQLHALAALPPGKESPVPIQSLNCLAYYRDISVGTFQHYRILPLCLLYNYREIILGRLNQVE
jgi:hypothetical protein